MISLMDKQEIIISHFLEGKSQWDIHRQTGFDRKTIRKYINQYEEKRKAILDSNEDRLVLTEDIVTPPKYDTSSRTRVKLTDEITDKIDKENELKKSTGRSKQQKKKIDIYECLIDEGYDISYPTVCNYIRDKVNLEKEAYIRQEYGLGDIAEFDWGHVNLTIGNKPKIVQMAVFTTAKGNFRFAHLYQNQKMESFLDSHVKFFNRVGGVHKTLVYDNMKVAVAKFVSRTEKEPTEELLKLSIYYGFKYRFCNARRGNEKGHVEKSVEYVRRKVFSKEDSFQTLDEANKYLQEILNKLNSKIYKQYDDKSPNDILKEELPNLLKLMPSYDIARTAEIRVSKYSVVSIDENKYSVPDALVDKFVTAKVYPERILIYHNNINVAEHIRNHGAHTWNIKIEHYLKTLKRKPGAIHSSTAMQQMNPRLQSIYNKYYTENPKDFIELIEIISQYGLDKIENIIKDLEKISPIGINTEKIKLLCNRNKDYILTNTNKEATEIEEYSKTILIDKYIY
ncbi:Transposase [Proteiniborus ethanoligenes]|uniref:Transposase n=1 Tax=Proteiniborus ethanoligenes TaxID=415015 RepID=A0A1H3P1S1_9FIRM|nr:IS21 family transposase [Proteiniborus ethanoligenes]SDY94745.1 Transposase [Proteiniborus ethanoligenes]